MPTLSPEKFVAKWGKIQQKETAVFDAYGWPHHLTDEQILENLLALNLERAGKQEKK